MSGLTVLHDDGGMTWAEAEGAWLAAPDDVLAALTADGFEQCKREMTTSRRDQLPAGGIWQGVNASTGSVASAIWVAREAPRRALVFIEIDGEGLTLGHADPRRSDASHQEQGGES